MQHLKHFDVSADGEIVMVLADENNPATFENLALHDYDKTLFVQNLGALLAQTREGVVGCSYSHNHETQKETVTIHYTNGHKRDVNVSMDSYVALVRDVAKHV